MDRNDALVVSWRVSAISAGVATVALVVALVIVGARVDAEALTTTALVLAIVSFVTQILIALFQFNVASQQQLEWSRLSEELQKQLGEVRMLSGEVAGAQSSQMDRLLGHVLQDVQERGGSPRDTAVAQAVLERVRETSQEQASSQPRTRPRESPNDALTRWLLERGIVPSQEGFLVDLSWTGPDGKSWYVESKSSLGVDSPTGFLSAVEAAANIGTFADGPVDHRVLLLPREPTVPGWRRIAEEAEVRVVWPGSFDEALADAAPSDGAPLS